jgi:hypothetical protein
MKVLNVNFNKFTKLQDFPNNLERLYIDNNNLTEIINLPKYLISLFCYSNQINVIQNLNENLTSLDISKNFIKEIKYLPSSLKNFYCAGNKIKELKNLPENLEDLDCSNNLIEEIDFTNLLPNLKLLYCNDNKLVKVIGLPDSLTLLNVNKNTSLDFIGKMKNGKLEWGFPNKLKYLYCIGIREIMNLPKTLEIIQTDIDKSKSRGGFNINDITIIDQCIRLPLNSYKKWLVKKNNKI